MDGLAFDFGDGAGHAHFLEHGFVPRDAAFHHMAVNDEAVSGGAGDGFGCPDFGVGGQEVCEF